MTFLIDTQCLLWYFEGNEKLSRKAATLIDVPSNQVFVSAATVWEVVIKVSLQKLKLEETPDNYFRKRFESPAFSKLAITFEHAAKVYSLPPHHKDPFDRMLIAQAQAEGFPIMTSDAVFRKYPIQIIDAA